MAPIKAASLVNYFPDLSTNSFVDTGNASITGNAIVSGMLTCGTISAGSIALSGAISASSFSGTLGAGSSCLVASSGTLTCGTLSASSVTSSGAVSAPSFSGTAGAGSSCLVASSGTLTCATLSASGTLGCSSTATIASAMAADYDQPIGSLIFHDRNYIGDAISLQCRNVKSVNGGGVFGGDLVISSKNMGTFEIPREIMRLDNFGNLNVSSIKTKNHVNWNSDTLGQSAIYSNYYYRLASWKLAPDNSIGVLSVLGNFGGGYSNMVKFDFSVDIGQYPYDYQPLVAGIVTYGLMSNVGGNGSTWDQCRGDFIYATSTSGADSYGNLFFIQQTTTGVFTPFDIDLDVCSSTATRNALVLYEPSLYATLNTNTFNVTNGQFGYGAWTATGGPGANGYTAVYPSSVSNVTLLQKLQIIDYAGTDNPVYKTTLVASNINASTLTCGTLSAIVASSGAVSAPSFSGTAGAGSSCLVASSGTLTCGTLSASSVTSSGAVSAPSFSGTAGAGSSCLVASSGILTCASISASGSLSAGSIGCTSFGRTPAYIDLEIDPSGNVQAGGDVIATNIYATSGVVSAYSFSGTAGAGSSCSVASSGTLTCGTVRTKQLNAFNRTFNFSAGGFSDLFPTSACTSLGMTVGDTSGIYYITTISTGNGSFSQYLFRYTWSGYGVTLVTSAGASPAEITAGSGNWVTGTYNLVISNPSANANNVHVHIVPLSTTF